MATVVSIPPVIHTALRSVEYTFNMPSVGVAPEKKYFRYRLKNVTNALFPTYLTDWKYYEPVVNGQNIVIDFYRDLMGIVYTPPPPFSAPSSSSQNITIINQIVVEYGERTINTETCDPAVDTVDGTTDVIDVINGIHRVYGQPIQPTLGRKILTNRPKRYSVNRNSYDWVYVFGQIDISVVYYDVNMNILGATDWLINETHPGSKIIVIPCGFQNSPVGTVTIGIYSSDQIQLSNPDGLVYFIDGNLCPCEFGETKDLYFQNQYGGVDMIAFECVEAKQMNVAKQYLTYKYDEGLGHVNAAKAGQRRVARNTSSPTLTMRRQFDYLSLEDSRWLDECAASGNVWMREIMHDGTEFLIRMNIVDASVPTFGEEVEFMIQVQYSEEWIYPN